MENTREFFRSFPWNFLEIRMNFSVNPGTSKWNCERTINNFDDRPEWEWSYYDVEFICGISKKLKMFSVIKCINYLLGISTIRSASHQSMLHSQLNNCNIDTDIKYAYSIDYRRSEFFIWWLLNSIHSIIILSENYIHRLIWENFNLTELSGVVINKHTKYIWLYYRQYTLPD